MEKNLPVPYKSEHDPDAQLSRADCAASCLAMVLNFLGENVSTDKIVETLNDKNFITLEQLQSFATNLGYTSEIRVNQKFDNIKELIDRGLPVIAVVHNGSLVSRQDQNFTGGHLIVVKGYRPDNGIYANDPDFWGELRAQGENHNYTADEFSNAWAMSADDGNTRNSMFVVFPKPQKNEASKSLPKKVIVSAEIGVNQRTQPAINKQNIVQKLNLGTKLDVLDKVTGDTPPGETNSAWYLVKASPNPLYVWSGAVSEIVESAPASPVANVAPVAQKDIEDYVKHITLVYETSRDILKAHNALPDETTVTASTGIWQKVKEALHI